MVAETSAAAPVERPPRSFVGPVAWMRDNLFSTWGNTILTAIGLLIAYWVVSTVVSWGILTATFVGADGSACTREGAGACSALGARLRRLRAAHHRTHAG